MGRRGPAPKPTALRLLHGDKKNRFNPEEPIPRDTLPVAPESMDPEVAAIWNHTIRELIAMKTVTAADRDTLICYCEAVVNHRRASEMIHETDVIIKGDHGGPVRNPALSVQRDSATLIRQFAQEFGLTPSGRTRISAMEAGGRGAEADDNPFASDG